MAPILRMVHVVPVIKDVKHATRKMAIARKNALISAQIVIIRTIAFAKPAKFMIRIQASVYLSNVIAEHTWIRIQIIVRGAQKIVLNASTPPSVRYAIQDSSCII